VRREICECDDLCVTFGLSDKERASQRGAIVTACEQAVKARGEAPSRGRLDREYTPIHSGLTACGGHAGRDFKLIVGTALRELTMAQGSRPSLDIIVVKTRGGEGRGYCVLVTEAGAERIKAVARKMTSGDAERARASRPPKGTEIDAAKHAADALAELGLTNVLGFALPDTRQLAAEQVETVLAATWGIREATVEGGKELWEAINTLAQAVGVAASAPPPAVAAAAPQLVETPAPPALAGLGDASDAETEVGGAGGDGPSVGAAALPLMPVAPLQPSGALPAPASTPAPGCDGGGGGAEPPSPRAAPSSPPPETAAPTTTRASRKRKAGAASDGAPQLMEAQADAPVQPLPPASPPTPEEATQRLREALASSDEVAVGEALKALEALAMTKATRHSTGAMNPPLTHKPTHVPPPRHLAPNRRGQGRP